MHKLSYTAGMVDQTTTPLRPIVLMTLVICVVVAMAPWLTGGQEPLAMVLSGAVLLLGVLLSWRQPEVRRLRRGPLVFAFGGLLLWALASALWSANQYSTWLWVVQWLLAGLAFRLTYVVAGEAKGREWLVRGYLISVAVFSVAALGIYLWGEYDRLTGTFYWANPAAAYLIPAVLIVLDRVRRARGRRIYAWIGFAILTLLSFWLTDSRAATAVLGLFVAIYLLVSPTPKRYWIHFVFIMAISFTLSIGVAKLSTLIAQHSPKAIPGSRFAEAASGESKSGRDRFSYIESAFQMWFTHPLQGVGAGAYGDVHPQYQPQVVNASSNAHNLYVQVLAELGLVGAVLLATVLLALFMGVLRGIVARPEMAAVALGVAGLLLHSGLDIDARYPSLLVLAGVLLGLVYGQWRQMRQRVSWRWPVVALLLMVPLAQLYQNQVWAERGKLAQDDSDFALATERYAAAQVGIMYNPDVISAEGINWLAIGAAGGSGQTEALNRALELARSAQRHDPRDGQHYQLEGRVLLARRDVKGAQQAFRRALELDPHNHPDYALDLATAQVVAGDESGAVTTAKAMLGQYPIDVVVQRNADLTLPPTLANLEAVIGNVALHQGDLATARAAAERGLRWDGQSLRVRALKAQVDKLTSPVAP